MRAITCHGERYGKVSCAQLSYLAVAGGKAAHRSRLAWAVIVGMMGTHGDDPLHGSDEPIYPLTRE